MLQYVIMDKKFARTFEENHWPVGSDWQDILEGYIVHGWPPGSFFTAVLSNDLYEAACHSHPSNTWTAIVNLSKWLINMAPRQSFGSREKVEAWCKLSDETRRKVCEEKGILMSAWDHLKEKEPA